MGWFRKRANHQTLEIMIMLSRKPNNAYDGGIFGTELAYMKETLVFITPAFKMHWFLWLHILIRHSTTRNYNFEHRVGSKW